MLYQIYSDKLYSTNFLINNHKIKHKTTKNAVLNQNGIGSRLILY